MRSRVAGRTLSGSLKYFDTVGREMPLAAENSSIVLILDGRFLPRCFPASADTPIPSASAHAACVRPPAPVIRYAAPGLCVDQRRQLSPLFSTTPAHSSIYTYVKIFLYTRIDDFGCSMQALWPSGRSIRERRDRSLKDKVQTDREGRRHGG